MDKTPVLRAASGNGRRCRARRWEARFRRVMCEVARGLGLTDGAVREYVKLARPYLSGRAYSLPSLLRIIREVTTSEEGRHLEEVRERAESVVQDLGDEADGDLESAESTQLEGQVLQCRDRLQVLMNRLAEVQREGSNLSSSREFKEIEREVEAQCCLVHNTPGMAREIRKLGPLDTGTETGVELNHYSDNVAGVREMVRKIGKLTACYFVAYLSTTHPDYGHVRVPIRVMYDTGANLTLIRTSMVDKLCKGLNVDIDTLFGVVPKEGLLETSGAFGRSSQSRALVSLLLHAPTVPGDSSEWGTVETSERSGGNPSNHRVRVDAFVFDELAADMIVGTDAILGGQNVRLDLESNLSRGPCIQPKLKVKGAEAGILTDADLAEQEAFRRGVGKIPVSSQRRRSDEELDCGILLTNADLRLFEKARKHSIGSPLLEIFSRFDCTASSSMQSHTCGCCKT